MHQLSCYHITHRSRLKVIRLVMRENDIFSAMFSFVFQKTGCISFQYRGISQWMKKRRSINPHYDAMVISRSVASAMFIPLIWYTLDGWPALVSFLMHVRRHPARNSHHGRLILARCHPASSMRTPIKAISVVFSATVCIACHYGEEQGYLTGCRRRS